MRIATRGGIPAVFTHHTRYWALVKWLWLVELVRRSQGRFELQAKRWIVQRTFGWLNRSRRLAKSYQRTPEGDEAFFQVIKIHLMVRRLA